MLTQDKGKRKKEEKPSNLFVAEGFAPGLSWANLPAGTNGKSVCWVGRIL